MLSVEVTFFFAWQVSKFQGSLDIKLPQNNSSNFFSSEFSGNSSDLNVCKDIGSIVKGCVKVHTVSYSSMHIKSHQLTKEEDRSDQGNEVGSSAVCKFTEIKLLKNAGCETDR